MKERCCDGDRCTLHNVCGCFGSAALTCAGEEVGPREELASAHVRVAATLNADCDSEGKESRGHGLQQGTERARGGQQVRQLRRLGQHIDAITASTQASTRCLRQKVRKRMCVRVKGMMG